MKQMILAFSLLLIVSGCNNFSEPKISEEEAEAIVLKEHTKHIGEVAIISLRHEGDAYIIQWENRDNCEHGTDYVNDNSGKITKGETTIC